MVKELVSAKGNMKALNMASSNLEITVSWKNSCIAKACHNICNSHASHPSF